MEEGIASESLPDLKELENKMGRKTPESLLIWMRDAALREDCWSSDVVDHSSISDSFSDKIRNLKLEMSRLRSADVSILRQLVAVHEGIEGMRWLLEERGTLASRGSSLTGSLTSLVALEGGPGSSMSPCRESPSPNSLQESSENEEPTLNNDDDVLRHTNHSDRWNSGSTEEGPPSPSGSKSGLSGPVPELRLWGPDGVQAQDFKSDAEDRIHISDPLRRALLRSNRTTRRGLVARSRAAPAPKMEEDAPTTRCSPPRESPRAPQSSVAETEPSRPSREEVLLGYDAQWRWVESEDDVTFL